MPGTPTCRCSSGVTVSSTPAGLFRRGRRTGTGESFRRGPIEWRTRRFVPPAASPFPLGAGFGLAAPTMYDHASDALKRKYLRPTLTGELAWCQLFSEPGAGSDLAGLTTTRRARRRRMGRQRAEGVEHERRPCGHGHPGRPHRLGRLEARRPRRTSSSTCDQDGVEARPIDR